jgi:hypothetical protein
MASNGDEEACLYVFAWEQVIQNEDEIEELGYGVHFLSDGVCRLSEELRHRFPDGFPELCLNHYILNTYFKIELRKSG